MVTDWNVGDLAVCVAAIGPVELGCTYTVCEVVGPGVCMRDRMRGNGLNFAGIEAPFGKAAFDDRRFLRAVSA